MFKAGGVRERRPITIDILLAFTDHLKPYQTRQLDSVMLWAAFTLAFFGFLRCSEFTYNSNSDQTGQLTISDIHFQPDILQAQTLTIDIKKSKTDPFRQGCTPHHCPV